MAKAGRVIQDRDAGLGAVNRSGVVYPRRALTPGLRLAPSTVRVLNQAAALSLDGTVDPDGERSALLGVAEEDRQARWREGDLEIQQARRPGQVDRRAAALVQQR